MIKTNKPPFELLDVVKEFYFATIPAASTTHYKPVIDDGCQDFVFFKEQDSSLEVGKNTVLAIEFPVFAINLATPPYRLQFDNSITFFTIKVQPWLNRLFFPFTSQKGIIDLRIFYGNDIIELHQELFNTQNFEKQQQLAATFIQKIKPTYTPQIELVKAICIEIYTQKGITSVQLLAKKFGDSRQELNRIFKEEVTYTLKKFIVIVRIMEVIKHKIQNPELSYTALGYEFGYFDQAHFTNDFKRICGVPPTSFFRELPPFLERHQ